MFSTSTQGGGPLRHLLRSRSPQVRAGLVGLVHTKIVFKPGSITLPPPNMAKTASLVDLFGVLPCVHSIAFDYSFIPGMRLDSHGQVLQVVPLSY
ncbi:hypothetical protein CH063_03520 [Colletotrichum higginsianum]|uniref:Uncharacterized protein n=1 Tax=Colletotrichum higginsianum (strain IMI 349063) TaxID=759273 RepID=H1VY42_COLHI|nr:hypothetical protein CH063_03520 [Colletotrichum higginsianum]